MAKKTAASPQLSTLAAKVTSENWLAKYYVQNLLGQIVCCDTSEALEAYPQSATKDLLRHYPYRLARLRTPVLYIGMEARKQQLKAAWEEFSALRGQLTECTAQAQSLRDILEQCRRVLHSSVLEDLRKNWGSVQRAPSQLAGAGAGTAGIRDVEGKSHSPGKDHRRTSLPGRMDAAGSKAGWKSKPPSAPKRIKSRKNKGCRSRPAGRRKTPEQAGWRFASRNPCCRQR